MKIKTFALFLIILILSTAVVYGDTTTGYINISDIGIHELPDYSSYMKAVVKMQSAVEIMTERDGWYNIKTSEGTTGWIEKIFVNIPFTKYVVNNTSYNVNLRKAPTATSESVGAISPGEKYKYIDTYHSWYIVEYKKEKYYVASWLTDLVADGSQKIYLIDDGINIRDNATFTSNVITQGNRYDSYNVYGEKNGWFKISLSDGSIGYVAGWLTAYNINFGTEGIIGYKSNTQQLNMRTGPSAEHSVIKALDASTLLRVISSENGWDKVIDKSGQIGYCNNWYLQQTLPLSGKKILLDPGHGGKDTGSIGYSKKYEKFINFTVASSLKSKLEYLGATVYMTRTGDTYIHNKERGKMADSLGVDILLSIHHNSIDATKSDYFGLSTYYNTINFKEDKYGYSLAESIYLNAISVNGSYRDGILDRNFEVLRETKTPAALIEIGFMSNPWEEKNIHNPSFQNVMTNKLANGILDYFRAVQ